MIAVQRLVHLLLGAWRPCIIGFFVLYWALVLPFLCWGAWATPDHPHAHPHFVFSAPSLAITTQPDGHHERTPGLIPPGATCAPAPLSDMHPPGHATATGVPPCPAATDAGGTASQSLPPILVVTILTLVFTSTQLRPIRLPVRRECALAILFPPGYPSVVPTPPPRFALLGVYARSAKT